MGFTRNALAVCAESPPSPARKRSRLPKQLCRGLSFALRYPRVASQTFALTAQHHSDRNSQETFSWLFFDQVEFPLLANELLPGVLDASREGEGRIWGKLEPQIIARAVRWR